MLSNSEYVVVNEMKGETDEKERASKDTQR